MNAFEWLLLVLALNAWKAPVTEFFTVPSGWNFETWHEISSFSEVLYNKGVLKNFSKFTDKLKKQSSGGVLSKDVLKNFAKFTGKHLCWNLFFDKIETETWNCQKQPLEMFRKIRWEALAQSYSVKKVFLEISQENTCIRTSFSIKLQA